MYRNKPVHISDETGQWRRYGLGMACVARSDIVRLGGYNTNIRGWGEEDVDLYERFVKRSGLEVCIHVLLRACVCVCVCVCMCVCVCVCIDVGNSKWADDLSEVCR
jgi:hypothetical protein